MTSLELNFPANASAERLTLFADVILPLPLPKLFTYRVPFEMNSQVKVGVRVIVPFGQKKVMSCIVAKVHPEAPKDYAAKYLLEVIDDEPVVTALQLKLFTWIAEYYMCSIGEVIVAALPSALKLSGESKVQLHPAWNWENNRYELSNQEEELIDALQNRVTLSFSEVAALLERQTFHAVIKSLIQKEVVQVFEEMGDRFSPKTIRKVRLAAHWVHEEEKLEHLFEMLAKKPKQLDIILNYLAQVPIHQNVHLNEQGLDKQVLLSNTHLSASSLNTLITNGVMEQFDVVASRFPAKPGELEATVRIMLSEAQQQAMDGILKQFEEKDIVLLHGITGSGKTEIYIELIRRALEGGGQVLYLLPEIALTAQIVNRLRKVFGSKLGVYHSKFSDNERVEIWNGILSGRFQVVVGVRSAVFLPFDSLALIIVDEEHESSYKQYEPAPRYNAREVSLMLALYHKAKVLLGSATPSTETYFNTQTGKWGLVTLTKRFGEGGLPEIVLVDTRAAGIRPLLPVPASFDAVTTETDTDGYQPERTEIQIIHSPPALLAPSESGKGPRSVFSPYLLQEIETRLLANEQVILFQNRRGYAPYITCNECNWIPSCQNCAVSLSYHKYNNELRCHYCGYHERLHESCPACGSTYIRSVGFGTEKVEDELKVFLPVASVQRMDLDTTRAKNAYQQIIQDFEVGKTNILVGTQMVTKGLDFEKVSLVGIVNADSTINLPDYRAHERAYQLFVQVAGRAGRRGTNGKVLVQTTNPMHPIFRKVIENNYLAFYDQEINERRKYGYPPFMRIIKLTVKHEEEKTSENASIELCRQLIDRLGKKQVLGPEAPYIFRIRNLYLHEVHVKLEREHVNLKVAKTLISEAILAVKLQKPFKQAKIVTDVDPV